MSTPYPCTIVLDRYNGCYSGALWTAWPLFADNVPSEQDGDDLSCGDFWREYRLPVGKGSTPQAALDDLAAKIDRPPST